LFEQPTSEHPGARFEMPTDWTPHEVQIIVSDYFDMLTKELRGEPFNKAEHNRKLQHLLNRRTRGSIEKKHQNISAVLIELGCPYIDGYKPYGNFQGILETIVEERVARDGFLQQAASRAAEKEINRPPRIGNLLSILVKPPLRKPERTSANAKRDKIRLPKKRNYLEIESRNRSLGLAGEKLVIEFERQRLLKAGKRDLANRIEHVSVSQGDQLGFDIQSFDADGKDRLIEVKTTQFGEMTPFFVSRNEIETSDARIEYYHLYRLFNFLREPKMFTLAGSLRRSCRLEPIVFSALPSG
jgi:hypothetical protein